MSTHLNNSNLHVKKHLLKRFIKRARGLDGTKKLAGLTRSEIAVYLVLIDASNSFFKAIYYSHAKIAKKADVSVRTVVAALKKLKEMKLVYWVSRGKYVDPKTKKPRFLTNNYFLSDIIFEMIGHDVLTGQMFEGEGEDPNGIFDPYGDPIDSDTWNEFQKFRKGKPCVMSESPATQSDDRGSMTHPPHSTQFSQRSSRASVLHTDTLTNADAFDQLNGSLGALIIAEEKQEDPIREIGIDFTTVEPQTDALRSQAERISPPTEAIKTEVSPELNSASKTKTPQHALPTPKYKPKNDSRKRDAISPEVYDASVWVAKACREAQERCGTKVDSYFSYFQYEQIAGLVERTGSQYDAAELVEYCVFNWRKLVEAKSTGPKDAGKLLSYPTLNQILAPWRVNTWLSWKKGIQTPKQLQKRTAKFLRLEKAQQRILELEQALERNAAKARNDGFVDAAGKAMYERMMAKSALM